MLEAKFQQFLHLLVLNFMASANNAASLTGLSRVRVTRYYQR